MVLANGAVQAGPDRGMLVAAALADRVEGRVAFLRAEQKTAADEMLTHPMFPGRMTVGGP